MASSSSKKRKQVTISIEEKLKLLKVVDHWSTLSDVAEEFGKMSDLKKTSETIDNEVPC